jgi:hypothetical protein
MTPTTSGPRVIFYTDFEAKSTFIIIMPGDPIDIIPEIAPSGSFVK